MGREKKKKKAGRKTLLSALDVFKRKKSRGLKFPLWMGLFGVASVSFCICDEMSLRRNGLEMEKKDVMYLFGKASAANREKMGEARTLSC